MAHRRSWQSLEKAQETMNIVEVIFETKLISEVRYTNWLSNFIVVKKAYEHGEYALTTLTSVESS